MKKETETELINIIKAGFLLIIICYLLRTIYLLDIITKTL